MFIGHLCSEAIFDTIFLVICYYVKAMGFFHSRNFFSRHTKKKMMFLHNDPFVKVTSFADLLNQASLMSYCNSDNISVYNVRILYHNKNILNFVQLPIVLIMTTIMAI